MIERFIRVRDGAAGPSALVRMPTGTGKSGVIAICAQDLVGTGDVLLLTPWDALVEQLTLDVGGRFFERVGVDHPAVKPVLRLLPSTASGCLADQRKPAVWIATIATLQRIHTGDQETYDELGRRLRLVVVDEGHYEPARSWSVAVRTLQRPTALFTATPYRNDFKYFQLDPEFLFHFSHADAENQHFLRRVNFEEISFGTPAEFCDKLVSAADQLGDPIARAKVIVRCGSRADIQEVVQQLRSCGQSAIGIHERFEPGNQILQRRVPDPSQSSARYWVHQFKLTEGIDSADFRMVAFYRPLPSERAFVQQVGRVLRNPDRSPAEVASVLFRAEDGLESSWRAYRAYDVDAAQGVAVSPLEVAASQPSPLYFDGKFRNTFDLLQRQVDVEDLVYPRSAKVCLPPVDFDLDRFAVEVEDNLDENDCLNRQVVAPRADTRVHVYLAIQNSPILARDAFYQSSLGMTVYRVTRGLLFFHDTYGQRPLSLDGFQLVATDRLKGLFRGPNARLVAVSLSNTDLSAFGARRRTVHARSIADLGPDLSDHAQLTTTASGYHDEMNEDGKPRSVARYVGFTRGRLSDRGAVRFDELVDWQNEIAEALSESRPVTLPVFDRYAEVIDRPADTTPRNILLDFDPSTFVDTNGVEGERLRIEDLCMDVSGGKFTCRANDEDHVITLAWVEANHRYELGSTELDRRFVVPEALGGPASRTLIGYLNREQAFRVVPATSRDDYCIYTSRRFCRPRLPLGTRTAAGNPALLQLLVGCPVLGSIGSEKGEKDTATAQGWAAGCLFDLVDRLGSGSEMEPLMAGIDLLVCDDMGTEIADFIALDSARRRVIAIHAKAFPVRRPLSASALHEVSAQAVKNLGSFEPFFVGDPKNLANWGRPWVGHSGKVSTRIRRGSGTPKTIWGRIREALRDPQWTREIWLVIGQGPSRLSIQRECAQRRPKPEVVQILYSLQSTWSAVQAVGNVLRVFTTD